MTVHGLWFGGYGNYAESDPEQDIERFADMEAAGEALKSRGDNAGFYHQTFDFANRPAESVFCPNVGSDQHLDVYLGLDTNEGGMIEVHDNGPDFRLTLDDRGQVVVTRNS